MPTLVSTIGLTGCDYTSIGAWITAMQAATNAGDTIIGVLQDAALYGSFNITPAGRHWIVRAASGIKFRGIVDFDWAYPMLSFVRVNGDGTVGSVRVEHVAIHGATSDATDNWACVAYFPASYGPIPPLVLDSCYVNYELTMLADPPRSFAGVGVIGSDSDYASVLVENCVIGPIKLNTSQDGVVYGTHLCDVRNSVIFRVSGDRVDDPYYGSNTIQAYGFYGTRPLLNSSNFIVNSGVFDVTAVGPTTQKCIALSNGAWQGATATSDSTGQVGNVRPADEFEEYGVNFHLSPYSRIMRGGAGSMYFTDAKWGTITQDIDDQSISMDIGVDSFVATARCLHQHFADPVAVSQYVASTPQDCFHPHTADAVAVDPVPVVRTADTLHGHIADQVSVGKFIFTQNCFHEHLADAVLVSSGAGLVFASDVFYSPVFGQL